ncbi:MAG: sirohydrochlorin chelatase [Opitutaceae bacterium]
MTVVLIDNGSLQAAAHRLLRQTAAAIGHRLGVAVEAVSWKHSDRIDQRLLATRAWTLGPWFRRRQSEGETDFLFAPFVLSSEGAIASALRAELANLAGEGADVRIRFAPGLADTPGVLPGIVADRIREAIARFQLDRPAVIVVDHGGPSAASAALRDRVAAAVRVDLGGEIAALAPASMESPEGDAFAFNRPLFAERLEAPGFAGREVLVAPLFLSPGRHAGTSGDLARIARRAERRRPGLVVRFAGLVGDHPQAAETLARRLKALLPSPVLS